MNAYLYIGTTIGIAGVVIVLLGIVLLYNKLVRLRLTVRSAWSDVDVQLKKRYDLVPSIVETVRGYSGYEHSTLQRVTTVRSAAMQAGGPAEKAKAEQLLVSVIRNIFALLENYPELKADLHFRQLQTQLAQLEDAIEYARRYYNAAVKEFNIALGVFPLNVVASAFRFMPAEFFELEEPGVEGKPAAVDFSQGHQ